MMNSKIISSRSSMGSPILAPFAEVSFSVPGQRLQRIFQWSEADRPDLYVKEHDAYFTRPATVNVASMGDITMGVGKVIVSDYRNILNGKLRMQNEEVVD